MKLNFSDIENTSFDALPAGTYLAKLTDGVIREAGPSSKNPGSEYINWEFTVQGGPSEGRRIWTNTSLLPQTLFRLKELLVATGRFEGAQLDNELDFEIADLIGADVKLVLKYIPASDQYDARNDVKRFRTAGAADDVEGSLLP